MAQFKVGTPIKFEAIDKSITGHKWKIDGSLTYEPEVTYTLTRSNIPIGSHTMSHEFTNSCGSSCSPISTTLPFEVLAELPQPPGGSGGGGTAMMVIAAAAIGFMMMAKK